MHSNIPFKSHQHENLTIEGYSRAAVQTFWCIPELKLGFDLGAHPWNAMGIPNWALSHCHLDHLAALPSYVARRRMMKMTPPRIFLPAFAVNPVSQMLRSFERLDRGRLPCELVGVESGQEFELSRELVLKAFATTHTVPSIGYIVYERRKKLKPEYAEFSGEQIRDLRLSGVEISDEKRIPLVGYTGDTTPKGLDQNPEFYQVKILITEMTFTDPEHHRQLVHKNGHMHLDDFVKRRDQFQNELIVVGHFSMRDNARETTKKIKNKIPDMLNDRLMVWL